MPEDKQPNPDFSFPDWLWLEFMDLCKKRGVSPATNNDLFEIVGRARKREAEIKRL